jgi:hypothetical protein
MLARISLLAAAAILMAGCDHEETAFIYGQGSGQYSPAYAEADIAVHQRLADVTVTEADYDTEVPLAAPEDDWDTRVAGEVTLEDYGELAGQLDDAMALIGELRQENLQLDTLLSITDSRLDAAVNALYAARVRAWNDRNYVAMLACIDAEDVLVRWSWYHVNRQYVYWTAPSVPYVIVHPANYRPNHVLLSRLRLANQRVARLAAANRRLRAQNAGTISQLRRAREVIVRTHPRPVTVPVRPAPRPRPERQRPERAGRQRPERPARLADGSGTTPDRGPATGRTTDRLWTGRTDGTERTTAERGKYLLRRTDDPRAPLTDIRNRPLAPTARTVQQPRQDNLAAAQAAAQQQRDAAQAAAAARVEANRAKLAEVRDQRQDNLATAQAAAQQQRDAAQAAVAARVEANQAKLATTRAAAQQRQAEARASAEAARRARQAAAAAKRKKG